MFFFFFHFLFSLSIHPNKLLVATGQCSGHDRNDAMVKTKLFKYCVRCVLLIFDYLRNEKKKIYLLLTLATCSCMEFSFIGNSSCDRLWRFHWFNKRIMF